MRLIIGGSSRCWPSIDEIDAAIAKHVTGDDPARHGVTVVMSGNTSAADLAGEAWALERGVEIERYPILKADFTRWGKYHAPRQRNRAMAMRADQALLFWDGSSEKTADMAARMVVRGKPVCIEPYKPADALEIAKRTRALRARLAPR